jgi:TetR/AcrR family transcriptional repressor of nem operon
VSRVSQAQAQENRKSVVEAASRLFREQGVTNLRVTDLMKSVGMTHGGFYSQFESKDSLLAEATAHAFVNLLEQLDGFDKEAGEHSAAQRALIEYYLSPEHRDDPGDGCPTAGFVGDLARETTGAETHKAYEEGVQDFAAWLSDEDGDGLARICTMVGAVLLARATKGSPLSEKILDTARTSVLEAKD